MKKAKIAIASALLVAAVATGCTPTDKQLNREKADALVETFEDSVTGTVKLTYKADYKLDVVSESASAKAFAKTIKDITTIEADFTAGSYYLHAKRVGRNLLTETEDKTVEALVWKDGDTYKYLESTMGDAQALANEAAAVAKIAELMKKVTNREAGFLTPDSLVYNEINTYEHAEFLLNSKTVTVDEYFEDPTSMVQKVEGGLEVKSDLEYVAYQTDGGVSELSGQPGATTTVTTNEKGYVTNYEITYNDAQLAMPIMTPAPVLHLTGSRKLEAAYGSTLTKLNTIEHHATTGTIVIPENNKGTIEVYTCVPGGFTSMTKVNSGAEVNVGDWLCVKVTPAGSNTVLAVSYAGKSETLVPPAQAGGYYCFTVVEGEKQVTVNFEGSDVIAQVAKISVSTEGSQATSKGVVWFPLNGNAPGAMTPVTNGEAPTAANNWFAVSLSVAEGYEIDTVTCNGEKAFVLNGYYCFKIATPGNYPVVVTTKEVGAVSPTAAVLSFAGTQNCEVTIQYFNYPDTNNRTTITNGQEIPTGNSMYICVLVTPAAGYKVTGITVNGTATTEFAPGFHCYAVKTAGTYEVVVTVAAQ